MDITAGIYPQFSTETTLEGLTLALARTILEKQKSLSHNPENNDYISISLDEELEVASVELDQIEVDLVQGVLTGKDEFQGVTFVEGTGAYPFNRTTLVDAFVHCALYQGAMENNRAINFDQDLKHITVSMTKGDWGVGLPFRLTITMTDIPIIVELENGFSRTKARSYLGNPG
jgi:hypothetical protein